MRILNVMVISLSAAVCAGNSVNATAAGNHETVYINNGSIQCESDGLSPAATAQTLMDNGIEVTLSQCGRLTGLAVAAQCGLGNININVHTINPGNLADAEALGFKSVAILKQDDDKGYAIIECRE